MFDKHVLSWLQSLTSKDVGHLILEVDVVSTSDCMHFLEEGFNKSVQSAICPEGYYSINRKPGRRRLIDALLLGSGLCDECVDEFDNKDFSAFDDLPSLSWCIATANSSFAALEFLKNCSAKIVKFSAEWSLMLQHYAQLAFIRYDYNAFMKEGVSTPLFLQGVVANLWESFSALRDESLVDFDCLKDQQAFYILVKKAFPSFPAASFKYVDIFAAADVSLYEPLEFDIVKDRLFSVLKSQYALSFLRQYEQCVSNFKELPASSAPPALLPSASLVSWLDTVWREDILNQVKKAHEEYLIAFDAEVKEFFASGFDLCFFWNYISRAEFDSFSYAFPVYPAFDSKKCVVLVPSKLVEFFRHYSSFGKVLASDTPEVFELAAGLYPSVPVQDALSAARLLG